VLARGVIQMARGVPSRNVAEIGAMRGIGVHFVVKRPLFEKSARLTDQRQQQKQSREARLCRLHSRPRTRRKSRGQRICRGNHQPSRRDQTVGFQREVKHSELISELISEAFGVDFIRVFLFVNFWKFV